MSKEVWVLEEAKKLVEKASMGEKVIFETGYGPSGLPHIGTFGEVIRTVMVMRALKALVPNVVTELIVMSDDYDGLRKVPSNVPNREMLFKHLNKPLTSVPDPFGISDSYGSYMNSKLCAFLDNFGFEYTFKSATQCYKSGLYDKKLLLVLKYYDEIMNVMIPTLGDERQQTYSPFLPICMKSGVVLQVKIEKHNIENGTIVYKDEDNKLVEVPVTGGFCKLQWKPDWAMRWAALGVDYEMHGKDILPTAILSNQICRIIGSEPPINYMYELFLDEEGKKISKSKGNGLGVDDWIKYADINSLAYFMYLNPRRAKRLSFDVIPRSVDEYFDLVIQYNEKNIESPVFYIHNDNIPKIDNCGITFSMLINLASACNAENKTILWGFIKSYVPEVDIKINNYLDNLCGYAVAYYLDFVAGKKKYKIPSKNEKLALISLCESLKISNLTKGEEIQQLVYNTGKENGYSNDIKAWFSTLYKIILGQESGPKIGSFIALYGIKQTVELIEKIIASAANEEEI